MIPGGIIGHEGGPCIILLLVPLGPVNILYLVWGTNSDMIFGPMGPLLGGTSFTVTGPAAIRAFQFLPRLSTVTVLSELPVIVRSTRSSTAVKSAHVRVLSLNICKIP